MKCRPSGISTFGKSDKSHGSIFLIRYEPTSQNLNFLPTLKVFIALSPNHEVCTDFSALDYETDLRCRITDEFLIKFLRARKFNIPKALSLVKKHMGFKKKNQDIFTGMDFEVLSKLIKKKVFGFLPYRCKDGCAVLVVQLDNWNPSQFTIKDICKAVVIFLYHSICDPLTQINGYKIIFDVKSRGIKHIRFCTPGNLYLLYTGTQECFPGRFKEIHILNMSTTFQLAWAVISPFLSEKLKKRVSNIRLYFM
ncbi:clavesin-2 [Nephila pilipes]|uniref:Clavesin-2 n=1 Tax=Nephila pilipes TaxID=299642 RepID=A0A8X6J022_NEPPI|nr:clavesin-2 [Nephila pilipes]